MKVINNNLFFVSQLSDESFVLHSAASQEKVT